MTKTKSSIDQLIEELEYELKHPDCLENFKQGMSYARQLIKYKKPLYRKEIEDAYIAGWDDECGKSKHEGSEDYFNQTFEQ